MNTKQAGFSLMELLIALAIVGILAPVSIPSYNNYLLKGHRQQAVQFATSLAEKQESYYYMRGSYGTLAQLQAAGLVAANHDTSLIDDHFTLGSMNPSADSFSIVLTATTAQAKDAECKVITIDQNYLSNTTAHDATDRYCSGSGS